MRNKTTILAASLAATLVAGAASTAATAAPAPVNVINSHKARFDLVDTVKANDIGGPAGVLVTKAGDRALVLTDIVVTHNVNTTSSVFRVNFRRGPAGNPNDCDTASLILGPYVAPEETVSINLSTGLRLLPGEQLCVVLGGATGDEGVTFTLTGYESSPVVGP